MDKKRDNCGDTSYVHFFGRGALNVNGLDKRLRSICAGPGDFQIPSVRFIDFPTTEVRSLNPATTDD